MWITLPIAEAGLFGWLFRQTSQAKRRDILLYGRRPAQRIPIVDQLLAARVRGASHKQERFAHRLAQVIRYIVGTHAFELVVLRTLKSIKLKDMFREVTR